MSDRSARRPRRLFSIGALYPLAGSDPNSGRTTLEFVRCCLRGGALAVQVREKNLGDQDLFHLLRELANDCRQAGRRLLVNDRVDMVLAVGADGVHLGQNDLPVEEARRLLGHKALIGLSTHNRSQFEQAQRMPIDYVALGPVYPTRTKCTPDPTVGEDLFAELAADSRLPVVAIGGIDLERAGKMWRLGADSVAVVSDLRRHPDPTERVREYLRAAREGGF